MWQIRILARLAHGELLAETYVGCIWLFGIEQAVLLTPDRTKAKMFAAESEVLAMVRREELRHYITRMVKDDEPNDEMEKVSVE